MSLAHGSNVSIKVYYTKKQLNYNNNGTYKGWHLYLYILMLKDGASVEICHPGSGKPRRLRNLAQM